MKKFTVISLAVLALIVLFEQKITYALISNVSVVDKSSISSSKVNKEFKNLALSEMIKISGTVDPTSNTTKIIFSKKIKEKRLVPFMKVNGVNSSFKNRKEYANFFGIQNYKGTQKQNILLRKKLGEVTFKDIQNVGQNKENDLSDKKENKTLVKTQMSNYKHIDDNKSEIVSNVNSSLIPRVLGAWFGWSNWGNSSTSGGSTSGGSISGSTNNNNNQNNGGGSSTSDTTLPLISLTLPLADTVISGLVTLTASSSDNVGVTGVRFFVDGNSVGTEVTVPPYQTVIDTTSLSNGTHSMVATAKDNAGNTSTSSVLSITVSNPVSGTTTPSVSFLAPIANSTVSGSVFITATTSDYVGIPSVKFYVDGVQLGLDATSTQIIWNTILTTNGTHTLSVVASDLSNNVATSTRLVTVSNTTVNPNANLISNSNLQNVGLDGLPTDWFTGNWGTNEVVFTHSSSTGAEGIPSTSVNITNYTDGDAKWYFKDVPVSYPNSYSYSEYYTASMDTQLTVRYTMNDASSTFVFVNLPTALAVTERTKYSTTITPPSGAVSLTVFHHIDGVGTLNVDSHSIVKNSLDGGAPFTKGMVSLTFDDGWLSQYQNAFPILRAASLKGVFAVISQETIQALTGNIVLNPSFEIVTNPGSPDEWIFTSTGTNNASGTFPVAGNTGNNAANTTITDYTDGEAGWQFSNSFVIPDQDYIYTSYYLSDVPTTFTVLHTLDNNTQIVEELDTVEPASTWTKYTRVFYVPENAKSLTIKQTLTSAGSLSVDDSDLERVQVYMSPSQVLELQAAGMEIASHTRTHTSLTDPITSTSTRYSEINNSRTDLLGIGVTSVSTMIYPYGDYNDTVVQALKDAGYSQARAVDRGFNDTDSNKFELAIQQVDITTTPAQIEAWIDAAVENKIWLILMYHQVDNLGKEFSTTPENLQAVVDYLKLKNIDVVSLVEGVAQMNP